MKGKVFGLVVFAVAMALVEAAVVVYLRELLGNGPLFPMKEIPPNLLTLEIGRETATIVMLAAVAWLSFRGDMRRMGAFLLVFAIWDASYYGWLRAAIGWPHGIGDWDILFLIPTPWVGPVWSVLLICAGMFVFAVLFLGASEEAPFQPGFWGWATGLSGTGLVVATYILEWRKIGYGTGVPTTFSFLPYLGGLVLLGIAGWITWRRVPVLLW